MSESGTSELFRKNQTWILLGLIILLSFFTYFFRYWQPRAPYWDENYYITDAQREMNHMFYMQIHPPLGKLLIAWGEELLHPNAQNNQFLNTEHFDDMPAGFSFAGYRLFPAMLSWLGAPLLFIIFLFLTRSSIYAFLLSLPYTFDNALLVHNRGAMLDGPMMFFLILSILTYVLVVEYRDREKLFLFLSAAFGIAFALGLTTKLQNAIMILLVPFILWKLLPNWKKISQFTILSFLGFLVTFVWVWQTHFKHMVTINPNLKNNGYYLASETYKSYLANGMQGSLTAFPVMFADSLDYVSDYNAGIPKLDLCKPDENGSPFFLWPIGAKTISYRWETPDGKVFHYLYLVTNPAVWFAVLGGVILSVVYLLGPLFFPQSKERFTGDSRFHMVAFLFLYLSYMATMASMDRVLFLYSYFPPLLFGMVLLGPLLMELKQIGGFVLTEYRKTIGMTILGGLILGCFFFFAPFTYYGGLTDEQFSWRTWLPIWQLQCVHCDHAYPLVKHTCPA